MNRKKIIKFFKTALGGNVLFSLVFLFLFLLELNYVGFSFREKITIQSSLDFSWFSDLIERFLHGFILGRDFTFTYGPLFQLYYSIPSLIFNTPSYASVALSPVLSFPVVFLFVLIISKYLSKDTLVQITYILFFFLFLGFILSDGVSGVKMLFPIVFAFLLYSNIFEERKISKLILLSFIPTLGGLYIYSLFVTCLMVEALMVGLYLFINRKELRHQLIIISIIPITLVCQLAVSLFLTHSLEYTLASFDSVSNYRYVLDLVWAYDRNNVLLVFPVISIFFLFYLFKSKILERNTKIYLILLILTSMIELSYALSRSDAGHFLGAVYPSIIAVFSVIFFFSKKNAGFVILGLLLFVLIPFKPNFHNTLALKNIFKIVKVIKTTPDFFSVYKLPDDYYFSEKEILEITKIIKSNKNKVYVYPYDSYILNMQNSTFNSYALGLYTYTNSFVEKRTVENFEGNPPTVIIFGIDTKGALNLDDIPNLGRNPMVAKWIFGNYKVIQKKPKYLVLSYDKNKQKIPNSNCKILTLSINLTAKESLTQKLVNVIKPPVYYLEDVRLPYSPWTKDYLLFANIYDASGVSLLFDKPTSDQATIKYLSNRNALLLTRISPFLHRREIKTFKKGEYSIRCGYRD